MFILDISEVKNLWLFHEIQLTTWYLLSQIDHIVKLCLLLYHLLTLHTFFFLLNFLLTLLKTNLSFLHFKTRNKILIMQMHTKKLNKTSMSYHINPSQTLFKCIINLNHIRLRLLNLINKIPTKRIIKFKYLFLQYFLHPSIRTYNCTISVWNFVTSYFNTLWGLSCYNLTSNKNKPVLG